MPERKLTVFIYLPGETIAVPAGIFTHDNELTLGTFSYGRRYLKRDNCLPVDPVALPLGRPPREVIINGGLYGSFRDAAPDYWGRLVIAAESRTAPEAMSEFDFLLAANATRTGNLDFRLSLEDPEPELVPPAFNQLADIITAAAEMESGEQTSPDLLQLLRQGSSMGGARPKCTVEWQNSLWIAKFTAKGDSINIPRLEYATMTLAGQCGINVPEMHLIQIGRQDVFLIKRFDRVKARQGWCRYGFQSGLSLMQWDEGERHNWAYPAIAGRLRRFMAAPHIHEFYRRMIFNIMVRNTDDHPRNHGLLASEDTIILSPAYDIVPSLTRAGVGTDFRLAMSIGDKGREALLVNAISQSEKFGLSKEKAEEIIIDVSKNARKWQEHFAGCKFTEEEIDTLQPSFSMVEKYE